MRATHTQILAQRSSTEAAVDVRRNRGGRAIRSVDALEGGIRRRSLGQKRSDPASGIVAIEQRAMGSAVADDSAEDDLDRCVQAEHPSRCRQDVGVCWVQQQPSTGCNDQAGSFGKLRGDPALDGAKGLLTLLGEDHGNGPMIGLDDVIGVDEVEPKQFGQDATDRGLAGSHETRENDVRRR